VLLAVVAAGGWFGQRWLPQTRTAEDSAGVEDATAEAGEAAPSVGASASAPAALVAKAGSIALESKGYIIPAHQILVSPEVSGRIMKLNVEEGRRVAQGEVLAEIETVQYQADYDRAAATLEVARHRLSELENGSRPEEIKQAEAELAEVEAKLPQLEAQWKRNADLRANRSISLEEYELSESEYQATQRRADRLKYALELLREGPRVERINAARSEVRQCEADLEKARWRLNNCQIRAPISGTILRKAAEEGNIVNPVAFNGSFSLCEMADLSDLEVELDIQERDIAQVSIGQRCEVRAEAWPDRVYRGVVSRLMPIADRAKGAVPVRVKLTVPAAEEGVYLKPEMGAVVAFLQKQEPAATAATGPSPSPGVPVGTTVRD
jgi:multidrug resistance efflux pump